MDNVAYALDSVQRQLTLLIQSTNTLERDIYTLKAVVIAVLQNTHLGPTAIFTKETLQETMNYDLHFSTDPDSEQLTLKTVLK